MDTFDSSGTVQSPTRRLLICDRSTVRLTGREGVASLWYPLIPDTPYQRVLDLRIRADFDSRVTHDPEVGNPLLHATVPAGREEVGIQLSYLVERRANPSLNRARALRPGPGAGAGVARWLRAEKYVEITDTTKRLASELVEGEPDPLAQAKRIFDHVTSTMAYDASRQSHVGSSEHALLCSVGNCSDIHALFISLARSAGIPARLVLGQALQPELDLCGYHCWAEFFVAGSGWVPADASCACRYAGTEHFGQLEMNHVAWSVGRDILLTPAQRGPRLLFFAGPHVELDGVAQRDIARTVTLALSTQTDENDAVCEPCVSC